jgi:hypothetical protein
LLEIDEKTICSVPLQWTDFVAEDLAEAVEWILADAKGQTEKAKGQRKP